MCLVMELCTEGELADTLKERKFFVESQVRLITKELASAIAYLHKNGRYQYLAELMCSWRKVILCSAVFGENPRYCHSQLVRRQCRAKT
ncbi:hypothetical protein DPMN_052669 [Dreissena polymorpha]|uniref:Protein kinase domain-containing protein n=1 Tax=Dreissena polymorpha TaxID=45954 RepID=A0A9D4CK41_DREPO|nr:hypothetical protein DPMN_052669 [Dreissena polymorpha]